MTQRNQSVFFLFLFSPTRTFVSLIARIQQGGGAVERDADDAGFTPSLNDPFTQHVSHGRCGPTQAQKYERALKASVMACNYERVCLMLCAHATFLPLR